MLVHVIFVNATTKERHVIRVKFSFIIFLFFIYLSYKSHTLITVDRLQNCHLSTTVFGLFLLFKTILSVFFFSPTLFDCLDCFLFISNRVVDLFSKNLKSAGMFLFSFFFRMLFVIIYFRNCPMTLFKFFS